MRCSNKQCRNKINGTPVATFLDGRAVCSVECFTVVSNACIEKFKQLQEVQNAKQDGGNKVLSVRSPYKGTVLKNNE